jgi:hypothetical protein
MNGSLDQSFRPLGVTHLPPNNRLSVPVHHDDDDVSFLPVFMDAPFISPSLVFNLHFPHIFVVHACMSRLLVNQDLDTIFIVQVLRST